MFLTYRLGDDDTQYRSYEHILHPKYSPGTTNNDVCLLRLSEPLNMTNPKSVKAIALNRRDDFESGEMFTVTGWGTLQVSVDLNQYLIQMFISYPFIVWRCHIARKTNGS